MSRHFRVPQHWTFDDSATTKLQLQRTFINPRYRDPCSAGKLRLAIVLFSFTISQSSSKIAAIMRISSADVPAEVVGLIANQMVSAGIRDAWKLRGISTDFRDAITDDILLHQSKEVLQDADVIMDHFTPRYLYHRVKKRLDVCGDLPVRSNFTEQAHTMRHS